MEPDEDYGSEEFWKEQERIAEEERLMNEVAKGENDGMSSKSKSTEME